MASPVVPGNGYSNCTASIISARHIITNAHCFPQEQGGVRQAFLLMDYYSDDNEGAVRRFEVRATPVERNAELDFAIAEVSGNPSAQFGRIALEPRDPEPGESLLIVHHPMGKPKHMTRGGCRAHARCRSMARTSAIAATRCRAPRARRSCPRARGGCWGCTMADRPTRAPAPGTSASG
jgi:hypothetical protein